ncbi:MAG: hypothetical protein GX181_05170 [Synergistaceae bacterium]|nr:hypothetical protein [Synergistota bacterium]NLM71332.1 hypothetical protein [Synergistaceae bacterium]
MEVDWAGKGMWLRDPATGEESPARLFVAVLPASQYAYVEAFPGMGMESCSGARSKVNTACYSSPFAEPKSFSISSSVFSSSSGRNPAMSMKLIIIPYPMNSSSSSSSGT